MVAANSQTFSKCCRWSQGREWTEGADERIGVNSSSQLAKPTETCDPWLVLGQQSHLVNMTRVVIILPGHRLVLAVGVLCLLAGRAAANDFRKDLYTVLKGQQVTCL